KQLNTWVSFQSAEQPLLGQFSVSGNREWFTRVKALPERACRKAERAAFAPANTKRLRVNIHQQVPHG
ncbi:hypothetical protein N0691_10250, partial [Pseudomonas aeruginosa]|nr:hypothetical protein [Pseudomonas aeruginosa]